MKRSEWWRSVSVAAVTAALVFVAGCASTPPSAEDEIAAEVEGSSAVVADLRAEDTGAEADRPLADGAEAGSAPAAAEVAAPSSRTEEAVVAETAPMADAKAADVAPMSSDEAALAEARLALADEASEAGALSLGDALAIVWRENPQVMQAELALKATGYEISGSYTGYLPYLQVQTAQGENDNSSTVRIVQPLWNGGLTGAQVDQAKARQLIALAELNKTRLDLAMRVAETYFNVALAQDQMEQWDRYLASLQKLLEVIERRAEQGASPMADQQTAISRLRLAEAGRESSRAVLAANQAQLSSLLNRPPAEVVWPAEGSGLSDEDIARILTDFAEAHPDRQLAMSQIKLQEATARVSKASLWPELSAQYRRQFEGTVIDPNDDDAALLVLSYQTNSGLRGYRAYQAEQQRVESAEARLKFAIRELESRIRVLRAQRTAALQQGAAQEQASEASERLIESFERQFLVGRKTWLELLNTYREANDSRLQSIAAKRAFWLADVQLALQGLYWRRLTQDAPPIDVAIEKK